LHKLLQRQLRKQFPTGQPAGDDFVRFCSAVDEAYRHADEARLSVERSLELMSNELLQRNEQLEADLLEIKRLELELRQVDKLRAVGQLASGVAHEINTPIQFVSDSLSFMQDAVTELMRIAAARQLVCDVVGRGENALPALARFEQLSLELEAEYLTREFPLALERALEGVARVSQIVVAMKDFGRPDQRDRVFADLNRGLSNTLIVAQSEIRQFADVQLELGELPLVCCYAGDINQVFLNLLVNAAHAIEQRFSGVDRGLIRVRSWQEREWVFIEIADNGQGIADADRARIFEPFFTTKPVGKGTGQGLAISRSIVTDKHGGSLSFESQVGLGTRFLITLPVEAAEGELPLSARRPSFARSTSP
jgi:two-component system NtrC family sensor kinase